MQEGDAGTKSLYIPPIRPLSEKEPYNPVNVNKELYNPAT
jgi:hypothetical protein